MRKWFYKFRISLLHATFHRNMKRAITARNNRDIVLFKRCIYRAEDAWKQIIILQEKIK